MPAPCYMRRDIDKSGPDYYPTPPAVTEALIPYLGSVQTKSCLEPAAGGGHMAEVLSAYFRHVQIQDIYDHENIGLPIQDFLTSTPPKEKWDWLITNPPFKLAQQFMERAPAYAHSYAFLGRINLLESQSRYRTVWSHNPPNLVAAFVKRQHFVEGRLPVEGVDTGSPVFYAWFIWKWTGQKETKLTWIS